MRRLFGATVLLVLAMLSVPLPASADTSDFTFDSFDADYTLTRLDDTTSHLDVVETIVARFPSFDQNRGIVRAIPDNYDGVDLNTQVTSVVDENGTAVPYETSVTSDFVELALGTDDFVHGAVTYVISYTQENVVRSFEDTGSDEFYWDVNGTGWGQPFGVVSATVHVDPSLESALSGNTACYVGAQGKAGDCTLEASSPLEFKASADNLDAGENLTVSIGFAPDTFLTPEPTKNVPPVAGPIPLWNHLLSGGIGLASLGVLAAAIVGRVRAGRGARGRGIIVPQYSEPKDVTILQAAHLVGRPSTAIPAAIVRLAVRKNLRILAYAVTPGGEPYTLQYIGSTGANPEDLELLRLIFGTDPAPGAVREFGQSQQDLVTSLTAQSAQAKASLVTLGYQRRASGVGIAVMTVVAQVILGIVAIITLAATMGAYYAISGALGVTMVVGTAALIASIVLAIRPLQLTETGAEARDYLLGMQMYLTLAEQDRLRALQSPTGAERVDVGNNLEMVKLYEKLLPWAVLWGVEDQWMKELAVRVESLPEQPDWFVGTGGFNPFLFSSAMQGFSTALTPPVTTSTSTWSSSGGGSFGGGSFGGGFSGGGGGGGGGGGR